MLDENGYIKANNKDYKDGMNNDDDNDHGVKVLCLD